MTIGGKGVKQYGSLDYATIFNADLNTQVQLFSFLKWNSQFTYARGKDYSKENLPFMSPLSYRSALQFYKNKLSAEFSVFGNSRYRDFAAVYGETETTDYTIFNVNAGYQFSFIGVKVLTKIGVENIFDRLYTTYADWNKIPRPGRNFYLNLNLNF